MGADAVPKALLRLQGRSLLQRTLEALRSVGVGEVVIVTGYRKEEVAQEAQAAAAGLKLHLLENPRYKEGAILSLWTAREFLDRPVLIMDADVLCPSAAFERLTGSRHPNCLLADGSSQDTGEEQMVFGQAKRALQITKRPSEEIRRTLTPFGESLGFLKLSKAGALELRRLLEEKVLAGQTGIEHEQAYPDLFRKVPVGCERVDGLAWTEIDTPEDLARAEREVLPRWRVPLCLNRVISGWFLPAVLRLPLMPNHWTFVSFILGLASVACIAQGTRPMDWLGALLFQAFYIVDNWDGEVARAKGLSSRWGGWFDVIVDMVVQVGLVLALAEGLVRSVGCWGRVPTDPGWMIRGIGWIAAVGICLDFLVTFWAKARGFGPGVFGDPARGRSVLGDSRLVRWVRANLTNENFSLVVVAALAFNLQASFLILMAAGCQLYWMLFLLKEGRRLVIE